MGRKQWAFVGLGMVAAIALGGYLRSPKDAATEPAAIRLVDMFEPAAVSGGAPPVRAIPRTEWKGAEWQAGPGVGGLTVRDGRLAGRATTDFPILHLTRTSGFDSPDLVHAIEVRMKVSAGGTLSASNTRGDRIDFARQQEIARSFGWPLKAPLTPGDAVQTYTLTPLLHVQGQNTQHLLLRPTDVAGATFEIESVRLIYRKEHLASIESGVAWQGLGEIYRESLAARAPERIAIEATLPDRPWLDAQRTADTTAEATTTAAPPPIRSLAVLPLRNIANSTRDEFLSVGLADALVTKLQHVPSLQVRPTSAVLEFQGARTDTRSAGEKLKVDGILEGHFLAAGDLVRVTLQLTDSRTGFSVWSDTIDGKRDDLLGLIDDVSERTVDGLNQKIGVVQSVGVRSQARSSNPQAYELYLRARALNGSFVPEQFNAQIAALKRAIQLDPKFAAAYADLATAIALGSARSLVSPQDFARAEWYARQAVRLDPNLPEAHLALGRVFVRDPERFRESVREVLAALRLETTDTQALHSVTTYFISTGDLQMAQCVGDRLVNIDPMSNEALTRGYWNVNAVDPEGAIRNAQFALEHKETALSGRDMRGNAFILQGNLAQAEKEADAALALNPRHYLGKSLKAMIAAARGDRDRAVAAVRTFEADAMRNHWAALRVAMVYAKLGDTTEALVWLRRAADRGNHSWYFLMKHPWLQPLHATPEFQEIVTQMKADLDDVRDDVVGVYQLMCK